jgi:ferric iron reductase protein FhuF
MIPLLTPLFRDEWAPYGEALTCAPARAGALRLSEFLENPAAADEILEQYARNVGSSDRRPVAAAWALDYFTALLPPVVAAASVLHRVFPIDARQVTITFDPAGAPTQFHIPDEGVALPAASTSARYATLLWEHLELLIACLADWGGVSRRLLWGNVARRLEGTLEQIELLTRDLPAIHEGVLADRQALLHQPTWLARRNPLFMRVRRTCHWHAGQPHEVRLHRQCCLYYLLPGHDFCAPCPLAPANNLNNPRLNNKRLRSS